MTHLFDRRYAPLPPYGRKHPLPSKAEVWPICGQSVANCLPAPGASAIQLPLGFSGCGFSRVS
jgi:hypothetical protein